MQLYSNRLMVEVALSSNMVEETLYSNRLNKMLKKKARSIVKKVMWMIVQSKRNWKWKRNQRNITVQVVRVS